MGRQALDNKIEARAALRAAPGAPSTAKAAALAAEMRLETLIPDLLAAFDRFREEAAPKISHRCECRARS